MNSYHYGLKQLATIGETLYQVPEYQVGNKHKFEFASLAAFTGGDKPVLFPRFH